MLYRQLIRYHVMGRAMVLVLLNQNVGGYNPTTRHVRGLG